MSKRQQATLIGFPEEIRRLKDKSHNSIVLLPISLGQEYHKDQFMLATLSMLKAIFPHVIFILADELQAYNRFIADDADFTSDQLRIYREALHIEGQQWKSEYENDIANCLDSYEVRTWRDYLERDSFSEIKNFLLVLYEGTDDNIDDSRLSDYKKIYYALKEDEYKNSSVPEDTEFRKHVQRSARKKVPKRLSKNGESEKEALSMNIEYILEECVVYIQWALEWKTDPRDIFLAYPAEINPALDYLKRKFFNSVFTPLTIKFSPVSKVEYDHTETNVIPRRSSSSNSGSSNEEKETSPLISIPTEAQAVNIIEVRLAFQRNLLQIIQLAVNYNLHSHDDQIKSTLSSFLHRMVREIPFTVKEDISSSQETNKESLPLQGDLLEILSENSQQDLKKFLAFVSLDMQIISEMVTKSDVTGSDVTSFYILDQWCKKLNDYVSVINNLIDNLERKRNDEPSDIGTRSHRSPS